MLRRREQWMGARGSDQLVARARLWSRARGFGMRRRGADGARHGGRRRAPLLLLVTAVVASAAGGDVPRRLPPPTAAAATAGPASSVIGASGSVVATSVAAASWSPVLSAPPAPAPPSSPTPGPISGEPPAVDVAIAPPPETFDEAAAPAEPPPAPLVNGAFADVEPGGGTWAVSIGINDYPGSRYDLRSAAADAVEVDRALSRYGVPGDQRLLITDRAANAETIERAIEWLVAHAGPKATAVFFYAGHVRKLERTTETIVAADGRLVTDARVAELLAPLAAPRAWIAIAACYGGGFTEVLAPGRILTGAAGADDLAYENVDYGRSYLVEYMVRRAMVDGEAPSSVEASFAYAAGAIARDHPNRIPFQEDWLDGELALGNGAQRSAAPPPPSTGEPAPPPPQPPPQPSPPPEEEPPPERCLGATAIRAIRCKD